MLPRPAAVTALAALLVLPLTGLAPPAPAAPLPATCEGRAATIVSVPGERSTTGTSGDDVIVGSGRIDAGAGDDVICSAGGQTLAGPGDDVVVMTGDDRDHEAALGPGDDTYRGGPGTDLVNLLHDAFAFVSGVDDPGADRISTGAGDDEAFVGSGEVEVVDLGAGADQLSPGPAGWRLGSQVTGGAGTDRMLTYGEYFGFRSFRLDLATSTIAVRGRALVNGWTGVEDYLLVGRRVAVSGSDGADRIDLRSADRWDVDLRGGADRVRLDSSSFEDGVLDLGPGRRDLLQLEAAYLSGWQVDLRRGVLALPEPDDEHRMRLAGIEDVRANDVAQVIGDGADNRIAITCGSVVGGSGDDRLSTVGVRCRGANRLSGGSGDDVLVGTRGRDRLLGDAGRDVADGRRGSDRCDAEVERGCER